MAEINWIGNELEIKSDVKIRGLEDDLYTEIDYLKKKILEISTSTDILKKQINLENDITYQYLQLSITDGRIDKSTHVPAAPYGNPTPVYHKICTLFEYSGETLRYVKMKLSIRVGFTTLHEFSETFRNYYIKSNKLSDYHKLARVGSESYDYTNTMDQENLWKIFLSQTEILQSEKIPLLPGEYSLYMTYQPDYDKSGLPDMYFGDYTKTDKSMFEGDHRYVFDRSIEIY